MKISKICSFVLSTLILISANRVSAAYQLPELLFGSTKITQNINYYGGQSGNLAVLNFYTDLRLGFEKSKLDACKFDYTLPSTPECFALVYDPVSSNTFGVGLMTSHTSVNDSPLLETAALYYPRITALGDVYSGGSNSFSDFAFWGRHLGQSASALGNNISGLLWKTEDYKLNELAQSSWFKPSSTTDESEIIKLYQTKIDLLKLEAEEINAGTLANSQWYLQNKAIDFSVPSTDIDLSSEGKIWRLPKDSYNFSNKTITYHGRGTIIIDKDGGGKGDITFNNVELIPDPADADSRLGIIVDGDVNIKGKSKIQAAIFSTEKININQGENLSLIGSFAAKEFSAPSASGITRFTYDYNLSKNFPPGFRSLILPRGEEK